MFKVTDYEVLDGNTFKGTIHLPWGVALVARVIRIADYDHWETVRKERLPLEVYITGIEATRDLKILLARAKIIYASPVGDQFDPYGRIRAKIMLEVEDEMVDLAVELSK